MAETALVRSRNVTLARRRRLWGVIAAALAGGRTVESVAAEHGVARETVSRWRQRPEFLAIYDAELAAIVRDGRSAAARRLGAAAARLERVVEEGSDEDATRAALVLGRLAGAVGERGAPAVAVQVTQQQAMAPPPEPRFFGPDMPPDQRARILSGEPR